MTEKTCRTCGEEKSVEEGFEPRRAVCKACRQAARQERRRATRKPTGRPVGRPKLPGTAYERARAKMREFHDENRTPHPHIEFPFETRACSRCGEEKTPLDFPLNGMNEDRLCKVCKACHREYRREWVSRNPEQARANTLLGQELRREEREYLFDELKRLGAILSETGALSGGQLAHREQLLMDLGLK